MTKYLTILAFIITGSVFGQSRETVILPSPKIGWDSLKNYIVYPEIARRSGLQGLFKAHLTIDSVGNLMDLKIDNEFNYQQKQDDTTMMDIMLYDKLRSIKWYPATVGGRKVSHDLIVPFVFLIEHPDQIKPIFKTIDPPKHVKPATNK